jgi:RNA polymerase sigma-70 factor (ECF subfamily)
MLCDRFEAEDAVQNLYLKLWAQREHLVNLLVPDAYCLKMMRNICIDRLRTIRSQQEDDVPIDDYIAGNVPPDIEHKEAGDLLEYFLATLSPPQRQVMKMQMNGYSFDEIADVTGLSAVNVRVIISRLRKKFRELYYK